MFIYSPPRGNLLIALIALNLLGFRLKSLLFCSKCWRDWALKLHLRILDHTLMQERINVTTIQSQNLEGEMKKYHKE